MYLRIYLLLIVSFTCQLSYSQSSESHYVYYDDLYFDDPVDTNANNFRKRNVRGFVDSVYVFRKGEPRLARIKNHRCDSLGNVSSLFIHFPDEKDGILRELEYDKAHRVTQAINMKVKGADTILLNIVNYEYDSIHYLPIKAHVRKPELNSVRQIKPIVSNPVVYSLIQSNSLKVYPFIYFTDVFVYYDYEKTGDYSEIVTVKYKNDTLMQAISRVTRYNNLWWSEYYIWEKGHLSGAEICNHSANTIETKSWSNSQLTEHTLWEYKEESAFTSEGQSIKLFNMIIGKKQIFKIDYSAAKYSWTWDNKIDSSFIGYGELYDFTIYNLLNNRITRKKDKIIDQPSFAFWNLSISPTRYVKSDTISTDTLCLIYNDLRTYEEVTVSNDISKWEPAKVLIYVNKEGLVFRQKWVHNLIKREYFY